MNEQQKKAIEVLNRIHYGDKTEMTDEEYFLLLEFVMAQQKEVYVPQYVPQLVPQYPIYPAPPQPLQPYYKYDTISCNKS